MYNAAITSHCREHSPVSYASNDDDVLSPSYATIPGASLYPKVLVVEDDDALRDLMVRTLAFEGYFVTEAHDAQTMLSAVNASRKNPEDVFDLIVTDVRMPGQTGLDALTQLRELGCKVPAIIVSALSGDAIQPHLARLSALFLPKPFALDNLRRIANKVVLESSPARFMED